MERSALIPIVTVSFVLLFGINQSAEPPGRLELSLGASRSVVYVGQQVKLDAHLENLGDSSAWLDGRLVLGHHLTVSIVDESGRSISYPGSDLKIKLAPPTRDDFIRLGPGIQITRKDLIRGRLRFSKPGTYIVTLRSSHGASVDYSARYGITLCHFGGPATVTIKVKN